MRRPTLTALALLSMSACAVPNAPSPSAMCQELLPLADAHAPALLADGGAQSLVTGNRLIQGIDAGCGR